MEIGNLAQWVGAAVTFLAVLVALFKEGIVRWRRRPILDLVSVLSHAIPMRYSVQRTSLTLAVTQSYYFRLWIENRGKSRAESVQVYVAKLLRRAADGTFREDPHFLPLNLRWSHGQGPDGSPEVYAEGISPGMGKHCDLGHIIDPAHRGELGEALAEVPATDTILALDLEVLPTSLSHLIAPGTYQLELRIAAANCLPVTKILKVTLTGKWFHDEQVMFRDGIGLQITK
jgi:hypothetical protein